MGTPMLRARQALRIIDRFERVTAESRRATQEQPSAGLVVEDLDGDSKGFNSSLPEQAYDGDAGYGQGTSDQRSLQRPPSHTTVDIPELAARDSARVSNLQPCCKSQQNPASAPALLEDHTWCCMPVMLLCQKITPGVARPLLLHVTPEQHFANLSLQGLRRPCQFQQRICTTVLQSWQHLRATDMQSLTAFPFNSSSQPYKLNPHCCRGLVQPT